MSRLSDVVGNIVNGIDALSGKCFTKRTSPDFDDDFDLDPVRYLPLDIALVNAEVILRGIAKATEYFVTLPIYIAETVLFREFDNPKHPNFTFIPWNYRPR